MGRWGGGVGKVGFTPNLKIHFALNTGAGTDTSTQYSCVIATEQLCDRNWAGQVAELRQVGLQSMGLLSRQQHGLHRQHHILPHHRDHQVPRVSAAACRNERIREEKSQFPDKRIISKVRQKETYTGAPGSRWCGPPEDAEPFRPLPMLAGNLCSQGTGALVVPARGRGNGR